MEETSLTYSWIPIQFVSGVGKIDDLVEIRLLSSSIEFGSGDGLAVIDDAAIAGMAVGLDVWVQMTSQTVVIASRSASTIYRLGLSDMEVQELEVLFRGDDEDLWTLSIRPAPDGSLLLLYERGLVCIDATGSIRWHRLHDDISARFVEVGDVVWVETQWPTEFAGVRVGYDLATGHERTS
jgi:hypothetical protein